MTDQIEILRKGAAVWNEWRKQNRAVLPYLPGAILKRASLEGADLSGANLVGANLSDSDLGGANLRGADLTEANIYWASLVGAVLNAADLEGANLREAKLAEADFSWAKLCNANLVQANLVRANLIHADLTGALLSKATLGSADLSEAELTGADLDSADLREAVLLKANLGGAKLSSANLRGVVLSQADLRDADFSMANLTSVDFNASKMLSTLLLSVDLSSATGLEYVRHGGPSRLDIDTIYRSKGNIPEAFLRGVGVPDGFITYMRSLTVSPIEYYSCFISYSSKNDDFAKRLHTDLQGAHVRCWFAPEDLKIGDEIRPEIDEAIRLYDKLLLVLSKDSVESAWVKKEVETAFEKERSHERTVLFPIRLDDTVMETREAWAADIRRTRHIGDFREWKSHDSYQKALTRLLRDLKAGDKARNTSGVGF